MVKWQLIFTKQAAKDSKKLKSAGLKEKTELILKILEENPVKSPPPFEKLKVICPVLIHVGLISNIE